MARLVWFCNVVDKGYLHIQHLYDSLKLVRLFAAFCAGTAGNITGSMTDIKAIAEESSIGIAAEALKQTEAVGIGKCLQIAQPLMLLLSS